MKFSPGVEIVSDFPIAAAGNPSEKAQQKRPSRVFFVLISQINQNT